jgi:hypothetical protein
MVSVDYDEDLERELASRFGHPEWCDRIHAYRAKRDEHGIRHVLSTRAIVDGAKMLAAGFSVEQVLSMRVFRGLPDAQVRKIREADKDMTPKRAPKAAVSSDQRSDRFADCTEIETRFDGRCAECGRTISKGSRILYRAKRAGERSAYTVHVDCAV